MSAVFACSGSKVEDVVGSREWCRRFGRLRTGMLPGDDEEDYAMPIWAGVPGGVGRRNRALSAEEGARSCAVAVRVVILSTKLDGTTAPAVTSISGCLSDPCPS